MSDRATNNRKLSLRMSCGAHTINPNMYMFRVMVMGFDMRIRMKEALHVMENVEENIGMTRKKQRRNSNQVWCNRLHQFERCVTYVILIVMLFIQLWVSMSWKTIYYMWSQNILLILGLPFLKCNIYIRIWKLLDD